MRKVSSNAFVVQIGRSAETRSMRAFSLLELVVVLAILAALATVALRAVSNSQNQGRYQQTVRSLNDIRDAIVGPGNERNSDGTPLITGFVADVGRLPNIVVSPSDPLPALTPPQSGDPFNELLSANGIPSFGYYAASEDSSVKIGVGWQGPYIRLGVGPTYIRDGWGHSFQYTKGDPTTPSVVTSAGSGGSDIYGQPTSVNIPNSTFGTGLGSPFATLTVQVSINVGTDASPSLNAGNQSGPAPNATYTDGTHSAVPVTIWICYYGPDVTATPNPVVALSAQALSTNSWQATLSDARLTIGPRVIKAYVIPSTFTTFNGTAVSAALAVSSQNVTLVGGNQSVNLILPHYMP